MPRIVCHVGHSRAKPKSYPNPWAELIGTLSYRTDWTPTRLADATRLHRRTLYRYMDGSQTNVTQATIDAVAEGAGIDKRIVAEAASGLQALLDAEDEAAIRTIRESDAPDHLKEELIEHIRSMRDTHAAERLRTAEMMLRAAHGQV